MPKLGLISLGCAKNLVDSEHMLARLRDAGWEITEDMTEADVGVVNTCGFIGDAKQESIDMILRAAAAKQTGKIEDRGHRNHSGDRPEQADRQYEGSGRDRLSGAALC